MNTHMRTSMHGTDSLCGKHGIKKEHTSNNKSQVTCKKCKDNMYKLRGQGKYGGY